MANTKKKTPAKGKKSTAKKQTVIVKKQSPVLVITLSILIFLLLGYICYDEFIAKDKTTKKENTESKEVINKSENELDLSIKVEDRYGLGIEMVNGKPGYVVYILDGGRLYYKFVPASSFAAASGLYDYETSETSKDLTLIEGLPKIKRIKGVNTISDAVAYNILAISEEGKVYMVYGTQSGQGYTLLNTSIKDYEVEDILYYNQTNLCTDESINDCNASYKIVLKDGSIVEK